MAYRYGNREQMVFLPPSIEDYVKEDDPVRAYDAFVEALDFRELGIVIEPEKVGNSSYDPKTMLKLLVYGYSYGWRSSRKLERAVNHNLSFIWLIGGLNPDHKTIAEFRRNNKSALKKVLKQCARLCIELDLIEGNTLFVDSTKIRANASIKKSWTKERCKKALETIDGHIEAILSECEIIDVDEQEQSCIVRMKEELQDKKVLKAKVETILKQLKENDKASINTTDSDCSRMNSIQGTHAGYNVQNVVDREQGLIVTTDVTNENNDLGQFAKQINQANEMLDNKCETACADSGYANTNELVKIDKQGIKVIVPSYRQASTKETKPFDKRNFLYDREKDCYVCPKGHILNYAYIFRDRNERVYAISDKSLCQRCCHFGTCTKSSRGRTVDRLINEETRQRFESQYKQPQSQAIYKLRQQKVEAPFGHIKRNLGVNAFLLRGLDGVKAEISLLASCFNISRMITIFGVPTLISKLTV